LFSIKTTYEEYPLCEVFKIEEYPMIPNPICWVQTDPNKHIFLSLFIEVIVLLILIIIISAFLFTYIINICITSKPKFGQLNKVNMEKNLDCHQKGEKSWNRE